MFSSYRMIFQLLFSICLMLWPSRSDQLVSLPKITIQRCFCPLSEKDNNNRCDGEEINEPLRLGHDHLFTCTFRADEIAHLRKNYSNLTTYASVEFLPRGGTSFPKELRHYANHYQPYYPIFAKDIAGFSKAKLRCGVKSYQANITEELASFVIMAQIGTVPELQCKILLFKGPPIPNMKLACELVNTTGKQRVIPEYKIEFCKDNIKQADSERPTKCENFVPCEDGKTGMCELIGTNFSFHLFPKYFRITNREGKVWDRLMPNCYHPTILKPSSVSLQ